MPFSASVLNENILNCIKLVVIKSLIVPNNTKILLTHSNMKAMRTD